MLGGRKNYPMNVCTFVTDPHVDNFLHLRVGIVEDADRGWPIITLPAAAAAAGCHADC